MTPKRCRIHPKSHFIHIDTNSCKYPTSIHFLGQQSLNHTSDSYVKRKDRWWRETGSSHIICKLFIGWPTYSRTEMSFSYTNTTEEKFTIFQFILQYLPTLERENIGDFINDIFWLCMRFKTTISI